MNKEKVVLALGGGGAKGAFHIGALEYILNKYEVEGIVGTSIGALNAFFVAGNKFDFLKSFWLQPNLQESIMTPWTFGMVEGFIKGSLFTQDGLRRVLGNVSVDETLNSSIKYGCVVTDMVNQKKVPVYLTDETKHNIKEYIIASTAVSPAFGSVKINGGIYMDGGYSEGIPVESATSLIKEAKKVIILTCDKSGLDVDNPIEWKEGLINVFMQASGVCMDSVFDYNVKYGILKYWSKSKGTEFVIISPDKQIVQSAFDFDLSRIKACMNLGYETASSVLGK